MLPVVAAVLVAAGLLMLLKPHRVRAEYVKVQYARPGWLHWLYDSIGREAERPSYAWQIRFLAVVLILIGACLLLGQLW
jgi:hypothetical protein